VHFDELHEGSVKESLYCSEEEHDFMGQHLSLWRSCRRVHF
jgi:hypothetical protein